MWWFALRPATSDASRPEDYASAQRLLDDGQPARALDQLDSVVSRRPKCWSAGPGPMGLCAGVAQGEGRLAAKVGIRTALL